LKTLKGVKQSARFDPFSERTRASRVVQFKVKDANVSVVESIELTRLVTLGGSADVTD